MSEQNDGTTICLTEFSRPCDVCCCCHEAKTTPRLEWGCIKKINELSNKETCDYFDYLSSMVPEFEDDLKGCFNRLKVTYRNYSEGTRIDENTIISYKTHPILCKRILVEAVAEVIHRIKHFSAKNMSLVINDGRGMSFFNAQRYEKLFDLPTESDEFGTVYLLDAGQKDKIRRIELLPNYDYVVEEQVEK